VSSLWSSPTHSVLYW